MKEKNIKINIYQTIPEGANWEFQPYKKVAEMPDKGTWAWCNRGFTLIELLVVGPFIGILVVIALP